MSVQVFCPIIVTFYVWILFDLHISVDSLFFISHTKIFYTTFKILCLKILQLCIYIHSIKRSYFFKINDFTTYWFNYFLIFTLCILHPVHMWPDTEYVNNTICVKKIYVSHLFVYDSLFNMTCKIINKHIKSCSTNPNAFLSCMWL